MLVFAGSPLPFGWETKGTVLCRLVLSTLLAAFGIPLDSLLFTVLIRGTGVALGERVWFCWRRLAADTDDRDEDTTFPSGICGGALERRLIVRVTRETRVDVVDGAVLVAAAVMDVRV